MVPGIPYGDILLQGEIEHCDYYFNVADVAALTAVYDTYEREAQRCVDANGSSFPPMTST